MIDSTIPIYQQKFNLKPKVKSRARVTRRGWAYTPKTTKEAEMAIKRLIKWKFEPLSEPIVIYIHFSMKAPKKPSNSFPFGDIDNYVKLVTDALNKVVYVDDKQICGLFATKAYSDTDSVEVVILPCRTVQGLAVP